MVRGRAKVVWCGALVLGLVGGTARSQPAPPLTASDFDVDLYHGPVIGSSRVIGMGGAYAGVAEGSVGIPFNAAAVAHRVPHSRDRFDWDIAFDFLIPGLFQPDDFDLDTNGRAPVDNRALLAVGGQILYKHFGVGLYAAGKLITIADPTNPQRQLELGLWLIDLGVGYALFDHQLVIGAGVRAGLFETKDKASQEKLFSTSSPGPRVGLLLRPRRWPLRLAADFSAPLGSSTGRDCAVGQCPAAMVLPQSVALPWELRLGLAYRLARGSFNRPVTFGPASAAPSAAPTAASRPSSQPTASPVSTPATQPAAPTGERYLLVAVDLLLSGKVDNAIGPDGLVEQVRERSGEDLVVSPRLGLESEVLPRRLRLRLGGYYEPSRLRGFSGRMHGTFAFELRLFDFSLWGPRSLRFASAIDVAERYSNLSLGLGFWH